jgi:hypothetical protein
MFGFGGASASARKKVASPAAALAAAAVKAATFCRNSIFYKWIDIPLVQWGQREEKQFFLVEYCPDALDKEEATHRVKAQDRKNVRKFEVVMSLFTIPSRRIQSIINDPALFETLTFGLTSIRHPYLLPTWEVDIVSNRSTEFPVIAVGNPFIKAGSLRDLIYKVQDPLLQRKKMYTRGGRPLKINKLRIWGRQILEGLIALKKHGFTNIPLHCGNVLVLSDAVGSYRIVLTGYETALFGYRSCFAEDIDRLIKKAASKRRAEPLAIIFGFLFFEMAFGMKLEYSKPDYTGLSATRQRWNSPVRRILDLIFEGGWVRDEEEPFSSEDEAGGRAEEVQKNDRGDGAEDGAKEESAGADSKDAPGEGVEAGDDSKKGQDEGALELEVEELKTDYFYPEKRKKGRVKLEEIVSVGFFQFPDQEDIGIMSVPIDLSADEFPDNFSSEWKSMLAECCTTGYWKAKKKGKHAKESGKGGPRTEDVSPLSDKLVVEKTRRGRYRRKRRGTNLSRSPPMSRSPSPSMHLDQPELSVTVEDTAPEAPEGETTPLTPAPTLGPEYARFQKMLKMGVPEGAVRAKMGVAGLDPGPLFDGPSSGGGAATTAPPMAASVPTLGLEYAPFQKMLKMGVPEGAVRVKMMQAGVDADKLFPSGPNSQAAPRARSATMPPPRPPPPMPAPLKASVPTAQAGRGGMLAGIKAFSKNALKKTNTRDKSTPTSKDDSGAGGGGGGSLADMLKKQFASRRMTQ